MSDTPETDAFGRYLDGLAHPGFDQEKGTLVSWYDFVCSLERRLAEKDAEINQRRLWQEDAIMLCRKRGCAKAESALKEKDAEIARLKGDIRCMVEKAADNKLDGYRELAGKVLAAEIRAEKAEAALAAGVVVPREPTEDESARFSCNYKNGGLAFALGKLAAHKEQKDG